MNLLNLGLTSSGSPFTLPYDATVQTFAIVAIRGAGKTCTATVIAEEMCKARLPWIAFDPTGVWWGLRATYDGKPGGFPVVVIGGQHGDIPLEKDSGARIAEALVSENVFAVIDLKVESKHTWRRFLTDFSLRLLELNPSVPRHLFIEEAPEFAPQRTKVKLTAECKEAVERLVRLGRNSGYGCTLISQRPATVDKDVLSQCENLFVMRTVGAHDRKALSEWILEKEGDDNQARSWLNELPGLPNGTAWFWSPHWITTFERVRIRERMTFHPGKTRKVGEEVTAVTLSDAQEFVEKLKRQLSKTTHKALVAPSEKPAKREIRYAEQPEFMGRVEIDSVKLDQLEQKVQRLRSELSSERTQKDQMAKKLKIVRDQLAPQYEALKELFAAIGQETSVVTNADHYEVWKQSLNSGEWQLLQFFIQKGRLTKAQAQILLGKNRETVRLYTGKLIRCGLVRKDGNEFVLQEI